MSFSHISVVELQALIESGPVTLVDIRDPQSYQQGHLEGARHVTNETLAPFLAEADTSLPLVVYCYHGNASQGAAAFFHDQGFGQSFSLDGGYVAWAASNPAR